MQTKHTIELQKKPGNFTRYFFFFQQSRKTQRNPKKKTAESLKRARHYHTGIAAIRERRGVDPSIFVKIVLSLLRLRRRSALPFCAAGEDGTVHRPPIHHPCLVFTTPPFIYPSVHLSIHQSISPFVAHVDPSVTPPAPPAVHIQTSRPSVSAGFQNWLKYAIPSGWHGDGDISRCTEDFFFFYFNFVH